MKDRFTTGPVRRHGSIQDDLSFGPHPVLIAAVSFAAGILVALTGLALGW